MEEVIPFVGREEELARFHEGLEAAARLILVEGQPGSGKTRLVEEALAGVASGHGVVTWTCESYAATIPYAPVVKWIESLVGVEAGRRGQKAIEQMVAGRMGLDASDALYLEAVMGTARGLAQIASLPQENARRDIHRAITKLLTAASQGLPLVLVIDGAQDLDRATARFLDGLLEDGEANGWTMVVLTRDRALGRMPCGSPNVDIRLEPLSKMERAQLFDAVTPALDFLPELRQIVIEQSIGTPLFLTELGRLVRLVMERNAGPIRAEQMANIIEVVPVGPEELIQNRIDRLDAKARAVLDVAAALGPDCSLGLLECFDHIGEGLSEQLRLLEGLRVLERQGTGDAVCYRFPSGRVRDVVYRTLLSAQRSALHSQIASALERQSDFGTPGILDRLAYHFEQAGNSEAALLYRIRAADRCGLLGELEQAAEHYEGAIERLHGFETSPVRLARMTRLLLRNGRLARLRGRTEEAFDLLGSARHLACELQNEYLTLHTDLEWAITGLWHGRSNDAMELLPDLLKQACVLRVPPLECTILNAQGVIRWHQGRFNEALVAFRDLAERARAEGIEDMRADALNNTGLIYWRWGQYAEAASCFRSAVASRMRLGDRFGEVAALLNLAIIQEQLGEIRPAMANYHKALDYATECRFRQGMAVLEENLSNVERRTGLLSSAAKHAARAVELARQIEDPGAEIVALENLGLAYAALGETDEAVKSLECALSLAKQHELEEKAVQTELDLIEVTTRSGATRDGALERVGALVLRIEDAGFRDLLSQGHRLRGRLQYLFAEEDASAGDDSLRAALEHAVQSPNLFEEWDTLKELIAWSARRGRSDERESWEERVKRIEEMIHTEAN